MKGKIEALMAEIEALNCKTEQEIEEARVRLLGKKGEVTKLFEEFSGARKLWLLDEDYLWYEHWYERSW